MTTTTRKSRKVRAFKGWAVYQFGKPVKFEGHFIIYASRAAAQSDGLQDNEITARVTITVED